MECTSSVAGRAFDLKDECFISIQCFIYGLILLCINKFCVFEKITCCYVYVQLPTCMFIRIIVICMGIFISLNFFNLMVSRKENVKFARFSSGDVSLHR